MLGVIAFWSNHVSFYPNPNILKRVMAAYSYPLKYFGGTELVMVDVDLSDPVCSDAEIGFSFYPTLNQAIEHFGDVRFVVFDDVPEAVELKDYGHPPEPVVYVVGDDYGLSSGITPQSFPVERTDFVKIVSPVSVSPTTVWSFEMLAIALYDRMVKG